MHGNSAVINACCRDEEIRKVTVSFKEAGGEWKPYSGQAQQRSATDCEKTTTDAEPEDSNSEVGVASPQTHTSATSEPLTTTATVAGHVTQPVKHESTTRDATTSQSYAEESLEMDTPALQCQAMLSDPATFAGRRLRREDIAAQLAIGACQPTDCTFPVTDGRCFQADWYSRKLPDNSKRVRHWLTYSVSLDRMYCLPCMLFSGPGSSPTWSISGNNNWSSGIRDIVRHEASNEHHNAEVAAITWQRGMNISRLLSRSQSDIVDNNRRVVECALDCIRYLSTEMIAFRGKETCGGKFMNLFRTLAIRDASAAAYISKIEEAQAQRKKMSVNLLSPGNVRIFVQTMKQMIVEQIMSIIQLEQKACIIFDSTQDVSKKEASVLLARYVEKDSRTCHLQPVERLLEVFTTGETSGAVLKEEVFTTLNNIGFDTNWIVGQCYDGAGNMRGKYAGLATLIQNECSKAVYIWCHAHRLNLVMNAVMSCCTHIKNTLGILEELYTFMNGHKRNAVFQRAQVGSKMQLKRVSTTRWNGTEAAVDTVMSRFDAVLTALDELADPASNDSETVTAAVGLRKRLKDIRVVMCMEILKIVYRILGPVSRQLQGICTDLALASRLLEDCKQQLEAVRMDGDTAWETLCETSRAFASRHGISTEFPEERRRAKKRMPGEQAADSVMTGQQQFKIDTFIRALDEVNQQLHSRFAEQNVVFLRQLSYFTPSSLLTKDDVLCSDIRDVCIQYGLQPEDVVAELRDFTTTYRSLHLSASQHDVEGLCYIIHYVNFVTKFHRNMRTI